MDWNNAYSQDQKNCQVRVKPADEYNGECLNIGMACRVSKASSGATVAWIHIPIHMLRNRFGNSAINGWDGNSVELGDGNGGTILAPQVGAGIKEDDNSFTGILIGTSKDPKEEGRQGEEGDTNNYGGRATQGLFAKRDEQVGLFGYHKGSRSIFLDARTGKSVFGESGQAQIVIDPSQEDDETHKKVAVIRSGDYLYRPYDQNTEIDKVDEDVQKGMKYREPAGKGMMIDLSTPQIKFGTGNFEVDKNGHIIARGGGSIGGWQITDRAMFNRQFKSRRSKEDGSGETQSITVAKNSTGMNSNPIVQYTKDRSTITCSTSTKKSGFNGSQTRKIKVAPTNSEQGQTGWKYAYKAAAFWAGKDNFIVTHDGYLHAEQASIGSGTKPIYIGKTRQSEKAGSESVIFSGYKSAKNASQVGFYLGTDGFALGGTTSMWILKENAPVKSDQLYDKTGAINEDWFEQRSISNFQVQPNGMFYARRGYIGNGRDGWQIGNTFIRNKKRNINDTTDASGVYIGTQGIALGRTNEINSETGQTTETLKNAFQVTAAGDLTATKGTIANWIISTNSIRNTASGLDRYGKKWTKKEWTDKGYEWIDPVTHQPLPKEWDYFYEMDVKTGSKSVYIGTGGIRLGSQFHVDERGYLYAQNGFFTGTITAKEGKIGKWGIDKNGIYNVDKQDSVYLRPTKLKLQDIEINADGSMKGGSDAGSSWSIASDGTAKFKNMNIQGGTIGGSSKDKNSASGGGSVAFHPNAVSVPSSAYGGSGVTFEQYIRKLVVNQLYVSHYLQLGDVDNNGATSYASFRVGSHVTFRGNVNFAGNCIIDMEPNILITNNGKATKTGVAKFSGGGTMTFKNGILVDITTKDDGEDIKEWAGN